MSFIGSHIAVLQDPAFQVKAACQSRLSSYRGMLSKLQVVCVSEAAGLLGKPVERKFRVHPFHSDRERTERFSKFYSELRRYEDKFFEYYRMSTASFEELLNIIRPYITRQKTYWRAPISAEERLTITLR